MELRLACLLSLVSPLFSVIFSAGWLAEWGTCCVLYGPSVTYSALPSVWRSICITSLCLRARGAQAHPPPPTSPLLTCHSANTHAPKQAANPSPKSTMQEGTYSATVCSFYLTLKVSFSFFTICLCISLFLPSSFSQSPAECASAKRTPARTHIRTHAHTQPLIVRMSCQFCQFRLGPVFQG